MERTGVDSAKPWTVETGAASLGFDGLIYLLRWILAVDGLAAAAIAG